MALAVEDFSYCYPGQREAILRSLSFSLRKGECVCITGASGSGKSTLLFAIQGLLKDGRCSGKIGVNADGFRMPSGLVFQNADSQLLCTTVEEEVAFGLDNLGFPPEEVERRVFDALDAVGLAGFEKRNVERLSAGEKQRVALASILSIEPALVLFDEPTGQLDESGKTNFVEIVRKLKLRGHAVIIVEHDLAPFDGVADDFLRLENGELQEISLESFRTKMRHFEEQVREHHGFQRSVHPAIAMEGVSWRGADGTPILRGIAFRVNQGEFAHLYGQNGTGKSTLLRLIAGLQSPSEGTIRTANIRNPRPELLVGKVALLFQNPQRQFFEDTVRSEAAFTLNMLKYPEKETARRVDEALRLCDVAHLAERSPFILSMGEQHRVALASVIAPAPDILLLDEPFAGLDFGQRYRIMGILGRLRYRGITIVLASHGPLPPGEWTERRLLLENGTIHED